VQHEEPKKTEIPEYYRDIAGKFNTWFRVTDIVDAENNVMSKCIVASSGDTLSNVSKHSMSPYFIINYQQDT
jgi:arginyl-tRNA synthetase